MYECAICLTLNHNARLHCQCCGTVPAKYSVLRMLTNTSLTPIVAAKGCDRVERHHTTRAKLQTVALDYYAEV